MQACGLQGMMTFVRRTVVAADTTAWLLNGGVSEAPMSAVKLAEPSRGVTVSEQLVPVLHAPSSCVPA
jgi:hypothetical protein